MKKTVILIITLFFALFVYLYVDKGKNSTPKIETLKTSEEDLELSNEVLENDNYVELQTFPELGISMEIPNDLDVIKSPNYNEDTRDSIESYTFYIQEYKDNGAIDFQIYGLYQFDIPKTSWEQLEEVKNDEENYQYTKEININGIKGFETKLRGERNNYVYLLLLDERVLRIAVSPGTELSKERADSIINTLKPI